MSNQIYTLRDLPKDETFKLLAERYPEVDTHALSAYVLIARIGSDLVTHFDNYFAKHQVSRGRFTVLALLNRNPDQPLNPCDLADRAGVTRATMTGLLDGLEREGLVAREHVTGDRRMLQVRLTEGGLTLLGKILPGYYSLMRSLMGGINEEEKQLLSRILSKLISNLPGPPIADSSAAVQVIAGNPPANRTDVHIVAQ